MSLEFESPEPRFDPIVERALLRDELWRAFIKNANLIGEEWDENGLRAVLTGNAELPAEPGDLVIRHWVRLTNEVHPQQGTIVNFTVGSNVNVIDLQDPQDEQWLEKDPPQLNDETAELDAYLRDILNHTKFSPPKPNTGSGIIKPAPINTTRMFQEYPKLTNYQDFYRHCMRREKRRRGLQ